MTYQTKNNVNFVWGLPVVLVLFDIIVLGGDFFAFPEVFWPSFVGGLVGALVLWANNKDMSVTVTDDKLIIKKSSTDIREYLKTEVVSYRISKDEGKTVLRISGSDKSEYEITSYFLSMDGLETAIHNFMMEPTVKQQQNIKDYEKPAINTKVEPPDEERKIVQIPKAKPIIEQHKPASVIQDRPIIDFTTEKEMDTRPKYDFMIPEAPGGKKKSKIGLYGIIGLGIVAVIAIIAFVFVIPAMSESSAWDQAIEVNTVASYNKYLTKYPDGKYSELARNSIEESIWLDGYNTKDIGYVKHYIISYPKGKYIKQANLFLQELENQERQSQQKQFNEIRTSTEGFYIINVAAANTEQQAKNKMQELTNTGYQAGYLWIPDYASLSGAHLYCVYIGPFETQYDCEVATEEYRRKDSKAYGLFVSNESTRRVQILGIGKVTER